MADKGITKLNDFISVALGKDRFFVRSDRFQANITVPNLLRTKYSNGTSNLLALTCEEASLPGLSINDRSLRINALTEKRAHTIDYMGESVTLQFFIDAQWNARMFFEDWMKLCVNGPTTRQVGFYNDYASQIDIISLAQDDTPLFTVSLKEVWPKSISAQNLSYSSADSVLKIGVTFIYKYWESKAETKQLNPTVIPITPQTIPSIELNPENDIRKLV